MAKNFILTKIKDLPSPYPYLGGYTVALMKNVRFEPITGYKASLGLLLIYDRKVAKKMAHDYSIALGETIAWAAWDL